MLKVFRGYWKFTFPSKKFSGGKVMNLLQMPLVKIFCEQRQIFKIYLGAHYKVSRLYKEQWEIQKFTSPVIIHEGRTNIPLS